MPETDMVLSEPSNIRWGTKINTTEGVTISWDSSTENDRILWGYTPQYELGEFTAEVYPEENNYNYSYTFPNLKPTSTLYYRIISDSGMSEKKQFITPVGHDSRQFTFIVAGDGRVGENLMANNRWRDMAEIISANDFDFFIHVGDVVNNMDNWDQWAGYYDIGKPLIENHLFFYTWGNHEYCPISIRSNTQPGNGKWYSFQQGNVLFINLLSEEKFGDQYDWLVEQLANTDAQWKVVYFHKPFFTDGPHSTEMNEYRETWWKAFDDYGVNLVLNGHVHNYFRTKPINLNLDETSIVANDYGSNADEGRMQIVAGGLGSYDSEVCGESYVANTFSGLHYVKIDVNDNEMIIRTLSSSGTVVDSVQIVE